MLCWLDVDVHKVSAIKLIKKKKHLVWMLDTGFLQQLVVRLFTLSFFLQFTEAFTASSVPDSRRFTSWTRVQRRDRTGAISRLLVRVAVAV